MITELPQEKETEKPESKEASRCVSKRDILINRLQRVRMRTIRENYVEDRFNYDSGDNDNDNESLHEFIQYQADANDTVNVKNNELKMTINKLSIEIERRDAIIMEAISVQNTSNDLIDKYEDNQKLNSSFVDALRKENES
jgi:hypothetical protein